MPWRNGLGAAAVSGVTSLVSGLFGRDERQEQIRQQQKYNLDLAKKQNQWNIEQWQRENNYNLPANQMQRLKDAGLNPDMMYQNGVSGMTAASSPTMTAGNSADLTNQPTMGEIAQNSINSAMQGQQLALLKAQTEKTKSETVGIDKQNEWTDAINRIEVELKGAQRDVFKKNVDYIQKQMDGIDSTITLNNATIANMTEQQYMNRLNFYFDSYFRAKDFALRKEQWDEQKEKLKWEINMLIQSYNSPASNLYDFISRTLLSVARAFDPNLPQNYDEAITYLTTKGMDTAKKAAEKIEEVVREVVNPPKKSVKVPYYSNDPVQAGFPNRR